MSNPKQKEPSKRDLILLIGELQTLVASARSANHDRNPNRFAEVDGNLEEAFSLCVESRSAFPIMEGKSRWRWSYEVAPRERKYA